MTDPLAPTYATQFASIPLVVTARAGTMPVSEGITFRELLSDLNPLQHIPIIGTIYRAVTGDTIPEAARRLGSFAVSGLMGGPIGMLTNLALLAIEKATGFDPEKIGQDILVSLGIGSHDAVDVASADAPDKDRTLTSPSVVDASRLIVPGAWSPSQLLAYGITTDGAGNMRRGDLQGSDVLNEMSLARCVA